MEHVGQMVGLAKCSYECVCVSECKRIETKDRDQPLLTLNDYLCSCVTLSVI